MIAAAKANSARATDTSGWMIVFMVGSCIIEGRHSSSGSFKPRTAMNFDKRILLTLAIDIIDLKSTEPNDAAIDLHDVALLRFRHAVQVALDGW
jgi:hypothetical protein